MSARRGVARSKRAGACQTVLESQRELMCSPRARVSEMQSTRLLRAAVAAVEDLGYTGATVAHITARARVSRRTFYDLFDNREDCLLAVLEDAHRRVSDELAAADLQELPWREQVRGGLWVILCFFDREPALARFCMVQSARGSQRVLLYRAGVLARLAEVIDAGRLVARSARACPPLAAEALVGAGLALLYTRLLKGERTPLCALLGELMGLIVLPYLGAAAARRERTRPDPDPPRIAASAMHAPPRVVEHPPLALPMRLTYRTSRVLEHLAEHPGASNRVVAQAAGIADQGQVSKLLARLERVGVLANTGEGHTRGEPNAWQLTAVGRRVAHELQTNGARSGQDAHGRAAGQPAGSQRGQEKEMQIRVAGPVESARPREQTEEGASDARS
jgi:AcrR family transcriptional regulator